VSEPHIRHAWIRAAGFRDGEDASCECCWDHGHDGRCGAALRWWLYEHDEPGGWYAWNHDSYVTTQILCADCWAHVVMQGSEVG
jgi:hypothetical protein